MDKRIHQNDAVAVHELCTQILKEEIIFYQELKEGVQPLVIIYQNEAQRKRMVKLAENVVFLDATYKGLTAYGYSFYALVARDEQQGRGTPLSYCISSDDTGEVVKIFLRSLKTTAENHGFDFRPRSFMVDRDTKEISAINEVFPNSSVLLCWFHVLQVLYYSIYVSYILPYSLWEKNQLLNESYSVKFHSFGSISINCIGFNILYLFFVFISLRSVLN
ncbi:uncharacterized protein LOC127711199 [Mytilus californianus]|uniref:uncharacterized protein LOC127711199 n=1 Tax=Mytilus californianus TaxID=6549 RepID=UPI0022462AA7|nr:uncharacterized protein LOC127711199 [Mytilus californianus]